MAVWILEQLGDALASAGTMAWRIGWSLVLGFTLSAVVQAVVRRDVVSRALGGSGAATTLRATGLGAAASSCSYAAVALARSLFTKGATFASAMVFQIASTNLVVELGIVMWLLLGWEFTLAEFVGGAVMIAFVSFAFHRFVGAGALDAAREQAGKGLAGSMEGHAAMDMSVDDDGSVWQRLFSAKGITAVSHIFLMEWGAVLRDIALGLLVAGALQAWVPETFWQAIFAADNEKLAVIIGPLIAPFVGVISFVCSVGNVPLAGVLWNGGASFGGVMAFVFADLLIVPILLIYKKYYGTAMMLRIAGIFYVTMVVAAYVVELVFHVASITPTDRDAKIGAEGLSWNYTTFLDLAFGLLALALVVRSARNGGFEMLRHMGGDPEPADKR